MKQNTTQFFDIKFKVPAIVILLIGFLLYAKTKDFGFVLDDKIVITGNQITKKGASGMFDHFNYDSMDGFWAEQYGVDVKDLNKSALVKGGRYRPLALITHSLEYELFGNNSSWYHLINALLYGITGVILFLFLSRILTIKDINKWWFSAPFLITLLFLSHPLHVEVVANIKGRDEILSLLFGLLALDFSFRYIQDEQKTNLIGCGIVFLLSLMAKETTISFVAAIPLALYFFTKADFKKIAQPTLVVFVIAVVYMLIRNGIISKEGETIAELMNDPFVNATTSERLAVVFLTMTAYFKLLFIPHPLTHDYYPFHLPFMDDLEQYPSMSHPAAIVGLVITLLLLFLAIKGLVQRKIYSFAILFFFGTFILVSNLLFPVGVFMNERFMYIPSIGFAMALVWLLTDFLPQKIKGLKGNLPHLAIIGLSIVFILLSFQRSNAWESDEALAIADVKTSTGSAKANMSAGDSLLKLIDKEKNPQRKKELINEAFGYLKKSLEIHPNFFPPHDLLGKLYFEAGNYQESIKFYGICFQKKNDAKFLNNIVIVSNKLVELKRFDEAAQGYQKAIDLNPQFWTAYKALGEMYGNHLNNPQTAANYLSQANKINPNNPDIIEKLGICMAMLGKHPDAINLFNNALKINPNNANIYNNLAVVYKQIGDNEKAQLYLTKSQNLKAGKK